MSTFTDRLRREGREADADLIDEMERALREVRCALVEDKSLVKSPAYGADDVVWFARLIGEVLSKLEALK
jgi:hypothetical protein